MLTELSWTLRLWRRLLCHDLAIAVGDVLTRLIACVIVGCVPNGNPEANTSCIWPIEGGCLDGGAAGDLEAFGSFDEVAEEKAEWGCSGEKRSAREEAVLGFLQLHVVALSTCDPCSSDSGIVSILGIPIMGVVRFQKPLIMRRLILMYNTNADFRNHF